MDFIRNLQEAAQTNYDVHPDQVFWIVVIGAIFMVGMGFMIGANDMANVLATSIGSKALKLWQAAIIGAIAVTIGATFLGSQTASAIRNNIVNVDLFQDNPTVLMYGMLCSLMGASLWLFIATKLEWPVSTTHSITGAILGFGLALGNTYEDTGITVIDWPGMAEIALSWVTSPVLAGILSALFYFIVKALFLKPQDSDRRSKTFFFFLLFALGEVFIVSILMDTSFYFPFACMQGEEEATSPCIMDDWFAANVGMGLGVATAASIVVAAIGYFSMKPWMDRVMSDENLVKESTTTDSDFTTDQTPHDRVFVKNLLVDVHGTSYSESKKALEMRKAMQEFSPRTEKFFSVLQVLSAAFDSLSLGASDIANAAGPFATIISVYQEGELLSRVETPMILLFAGGVCIALGIIVMGYHVVKTLGIKLVAVTPSRGFCIEMSSSLILLIFANAGIPLSSTHCQVGATVGLGMTERRDPNNHTMMHKIFGNAVNWQLMGLIAASWVLTIIVAGTFSAIFFSFGAYAPTILNI